MITRRLNKKELRLKWIKLRQKLSLSRRKEASQALAVALFPPGIIASFASFRDEINTHPLNKILAQKKILALPRIEKDRMIFYRVDNLDEQLISSPLGILEPNPSLCSPVHQLDVILVPGLAFDENRHRLGYGKGHYDRYLIEHPVFSIGIGFKEQLTKSLPHEAHDVQLDKLMLF